jgi:hypothetical protein
MPIPNRIQPGRTARGLNILLWACQFLLTGLFLFAGIAKLRMPAEALAEMSGLPGPFMLFVAVAEIAGALGLVLPGILRVRRALTPAAAVGLLAIMSGATALSVIHVGLAAAVPPLVTGVLLVAVARGRRSWAANWDLSRRPAPVSILGSLVRRVG